MFGTWSFEPPSRGGGTIHQSFKPATTAQKAPQQACNSCRVRKIKCSGEKFGCSRCKALDSPCQYTKSSGKGRNHHRTSESSQGGKDSGGQGQSQSQGKHKYPISDSNTDNLVPDGETCSSTRTIAVQLPIWMGLESADTQSQPRQYFHSSYTHLSHPSHHPSAANQQQHQLESAEWTSLLLDLVSKTASPDVDLNSQMCSAMYVKDAGPNHSEPGEAPSYTTSVPPSMVTDLDSLVSHTRSTASFTASSGSSQGHSAPSSSAGSLEPRCNCLTRLSLLLDEFESPSSESTMPDIALVALKEALASALVTLGCVTCTSKQETMTLLTLLISQLVNFFQMITSMIQSHTGPSRAAAETSLQIRPAFVGEYEIDSVTEWDVVMRTLALMLAQRLKSLAKRIQNVLIVANHESLLRRLVTAQTRLTTAQAQLANPAPEIEEQGQWY